MSRSSVAVIHTVLYVIRRSAFQLTDCKVSLVVVVCSGFLFHSCTRTLSTLKGAEPICMSLVM